MRNVQILDTKFITEGRAVGVQSYGKFIAYTNQPVPIFRRSAWRISHRALIHKRNFPMLKCRKIFMRPITAF